MSKYTVLKRFIGNFNTEDEVLNNIQYSNNDYHYDKSKEHYYVINNNNV